MSTNGKKQALVTGASAGIGEEFARRLARDGFGLTFVARRQDRLDALAAELREAHGAQVEVIAADLASDDGCARVEEFLRSHEIELLVNNAGFGTYGDFHELPLDRETEEIKLNVLALVRLTHAALQGMVARGRGSIINVASMAGFQPIPHNATYAASKAYVLHFSEALHEEVRPHGVSVTALCPGPVHTEFQQVAGIDPARIPGAAWTDTAMVVESGLSAARGRRAISIPGAINAMMAASVRLAPRFVARQVAGSMMRRSGRDAAG